MLKTTKLFSIYMLCAYDIAINESELVWEAQCHFGPLRKFVLEGSDFRQHKDLASAIQAYLRWRYKHKRHAAILREQNKIKVV